VKILEGNSHVYFRNWERECGVRLGVRRSAVLCFYCGGQHHNVGIHTLTSWSSPRDSLIYSSRCLTTGLSEHSVSCVCRNLVCDKVRRRCTYALRSFCDYTPRRPAYDSLNRLFLCGTADSSFIHLDFESRRTKRDVCAQGCSVEVSP
jgi:hypothetical protein